MIEAAVSTSVDMKWNAARVQSDEFAPPPFSDLAESLECAGVAMPRCHASLHQTLMWHASLSVSSDSS